MADVVESTDLHALGIRLIAQAFAKRREDFPEAVMVIEDGPDDKPVYIIVGSHAPELVVSGRSAFGVFVPPEAQNPVASFASHEDAIQWATVKYPDSDFVINETDPGDRPAVRVSVAALVTRGDNFLFSRTRSKQQWTLPEAPLRVGMTPQCAATAAAKLVGIDADQWKIPARIPYINMYFSDADQHVITLCVAGTYNNGAPVACDLYDRVEWMPKNSAPEPLSPLIQAAIQIVSS